MLNVMTVRYRGPIAATAGVAAASTAAHTAQATRLLTPAARLMRAALLPHPHGLEGPVTVLVLLVSRDALVADGPDRPPDVLDPGIAALEPTALADDRHDVIVVRVDQREHLHLEAVPGLDPLLQRRDDSVPPIVELGFGVGAGYVVLDVGIEVLEEPPGVPRVMAGDRERLQGAPNQLDVLERHRLPPAPGGVAGRARCGQGRRARHQGVGHGVVVVWPPGGAALGRG